MMDLSALWASAAPLLTEGAIKIGGPSSSTWSAAG